MQAKDMAVWVGLIAAIAGGAVGYGDLRGTLTEKVNALQTQISSIDGEVQRNNTVLHSRITRAETEVNSRLKDHDKAIADLNEAALRRVTEVETRIVSLTGKIDRLTEMITDLRSRP